MPYIRLRRALSLYVEYIITSIHYLFRIWIDFLWLQLSSHVPFTCSEYLLSFVSPVVIHIVHISLIIFIRLISWINARNSSKSGKSLLTSTTPAKNGFTFWQWEKHFWRIEKSQQSMVLALLNTLDFRQNSSELAERLVDSFQKRSSFRFKASYIISGRHPYWIQSFQHWTFDYIGDLHTSGLSRIYRS